MFNSVKKSLKTSTPYLVVGTGILVGLVLTKTRVSSQPVSILRLAVTTENLQSLIDNTEGVISFDVTPNNKVWIINSATREVWP